MSRRNCGTQHLCSVIVVAVLASAGGGSAAEKILFSDDFNDMSEAGWTTIAGYILDSPVPFPRGQSDEEWADDTFTDNSYFKDGNGRLFLDARAWEAHVTIVAGDPNWTDVVIEADVGHIFDPRFAMEDNIKRARRKHAKLTKSASGFQEPDGRLITGKSPLTQRDYRVYGLYGRVQVPDLPETWGNHAFYSFELGRNRSSDKKGSRLSIRKRIVSGYHVTAYADLPGQTTSASKIKWGGHSDCYYLKQIYLTNEQMANANVWGKTDHPSTKTIHLRFEIRGSGPVRLKGTATFPYGKSVTIEATDHNWDGKGYITHGRAWLWAFETLMWADNFKVIGVSEKEK